MVSEKRKQEISENAQIESLINSNIKEERPSMELFKDTNIKVKTELTRDEVSLTAKLYFLTEYFELEGFKEMLDNFLKLRVSKDRKGRKEYVDIGKSEINNNLLSNPFNRNG